MSEVVGSFFVGGQFMSGEHTERRESGLFVKDAVLSPHKVRVTLSCRGRGSNPCNGSIQQSDNIPHV